MSQEALVQISSLLRAYRRILCRTHRIGLCSDNQWQGEVPSHRSRQVGFCVGKIDSAEGGTNGFCNARPNSNGYPSTYERPPSGNRGGNFSCVNHIKLSTTIFRRALTIGRRRHASPPSGISAIRLALRN